MHHQVIKRKGKKIPEQIVLHQIKSWSRQTRGVNILIKFIGKSELSLLGQVLFSPPHSSQPTMILYRSLKLQYPFSDSYKDWELLFIYLLQHNEHHSFQSLFYKMYTYILFYVYINTNSYVCQAAKIHTQKVTAVLLTQVSPTGSARSASPGEEGTAGLSGKFAIDLACGSILICLSKYLYSGYLCGQEIICSLEL